MFLDGDTEFIGDVQFAGYFKVEQPGLLNQVGKRQQGIDETIDFTGVDFFQSGAEIRNFQNADVWIAFFSKHK